jgi:DNA-binding beta-propeller fold protein YncE
MIDPGTGALTAIAGSPFAAGSFPHCVAVDPSDRFAYVANGFDNSVSGYMIDPGTGALTAIASSPFSAGSFPQYVAVDPSGKFAYGANQLTANISGYTIDPNTGALTAMAGSPFTAGEAPVSVAVDPSDKFAYAANEASGTVSGYTIDQSTGALTAIVGSPFIAGFVPQSVAITPLVPFAASFAKLEIKARPEAGFDLKESFTLARNTNGINPATENVTLQIATFSVAIPPGSFKLNPNGRFEFEETIQGVRLEVQIVPLGNNIFNFKVEGKGVDLTGLTNPVTVVLSIGIDSGTTTVIAHHSGQAGH